MKSSELKLSKIKLISDLVIFSFKFLNGKSQFKFEMWSLLRCPLSIINYKKLRLLQPLNPAQSPLNPVQSPLNPASVNMSTLTGIADPNVSWSYLKTR